jgi:hypothetical protein
MTIKAKLALGAAASALLMLGSCGGRESSGNLAADDVTAGDLTANDLTDLDPGDALMADPGLTLNTEPVDSEAEGNEGEAEHGHHLEASENAAEGSGGNGTATIATTVVPAPTGTTFDRIGEGPRVWIPPPPPPPPPVVMFVPTTPVPGQEVRPPPVRVPR